MKKIGFLSFGKSAGSDGPSPELFQGLRRLLIPVRLGCFGLQDLVGNLSNVASPSNTPDWTLPISLGAEPVDN